MTRSWERVRVAVSASVLEVIQIIDSGALQVAVVVDEHGRLLGTVTDGDIRRGLLQGVALEDGVDRIMNDRPTTAQVSDTREAMLAIMKLKRLHHIPVLDAERCVVDIVTIDTILQSNHRDNWVLIMAGGLGTRLRPLTDDIPKPLLKVGNRPLLETIISNFIEHGFHRFYLSVNYKAAMIQDYFGDGSRWGITLRYIHEEQRLGTAGALGLLGERLTQPLLVMNGDLLTKVNFQQLLDFHVESHALATMCVREYNYQIPYGVVSVDQHRLLGIQEKPLQSCLVSAGIYVLEPDVLDLVPRNTFFDMPNLFQKLLDLGVDTAAFPIREYWLDIGHHDDFQRANGEFSEVFG